MVIPVLRATGWDQIPGLRHGFSTRIGGVSQIYTGGQQGELNLGLTADDERDRVLANRRLLLQTLGGDRWDGAEIKTVRQIHSARIERVDAAYTPGSVEADGLITNQPGVMLGILAADCVPVLVADVQRGIAGAFHAGWRGTAARIVEIGVAQMVDELGAKVGDLVAAVGPSIGSCCYEVGPDLQKTFSQEFEYGSELFSRGTHLDLWEANRRQLLAAGLAPEQITVIGECTACSRINGARKYFSHRAEAGFTGRGMGIIGFDPA
ncbi:peptidoglycan editing factor PgeF [Granulicella tundricola]|uniref:Purine nucleoside phosphorylase n=1 Tax=Granulicella tundricola (strain ATCC BAA-1859 / DSM 23138 / MP5ACTX9) TaxID=1198114 RepID=E8WWF4_GRATM|nr:peptidoglycan editing factor PgeF [Granulicella tundricola]ADW69618.1 protein of unknown function DUF152 [Granulicella tundricola MP5ACTX9]